MYIAIGKIVQTRGIQGYVKAVSFSGLPDRFLGLKTAYLKIDQEMRGFIIEDVQLQNQASLIKFKGVETREAARFLVKKELWLPEGQKVKLPQDTYFIHDLVGLQVFDIEQHYLGELYDVIQNAGNDIYLVRHEEGELLIPAVSEFVKEINLQEKKMVVQLIEGMID